MSRSQKVILMGVLGPIFLLWHAAAIAHHSHANIDRNKIQQHTGIVSEYSWTNPHVFLKVMAPNPAGDIVEYSIELLHPPGMLARGWDKGTFSEGDRITWEGPADRNPQRYYSGLTWAERGDGVRFTTEKREELILPSTDFTGLWVRDLRGARPHYFPPADWPYTAVGQALVDNFNENQNPMLECMEQGPPKATLLPYPIKISRPDNNTLMFEYELRHSARIIHLNGSGEPGEASPWGYSKGRFEGDTLVIETRNFAENRWGSHTGVDSSNQKHLVEKFRLGNDGLALEVEMTLSDPVYLSEPVTFDYYLSKMQDRDLIEVPCSTRNARLFLEGGYTGTQ